MGFLRLNKVLSKHKWKRKNGDEFLEEMRTKEDRLLYGALAIVLGLLLLVIVSTMVQ